MHELRAGALGRDLASKPGRILQGGDRISQEMTSGFLFFLFFFFFPSPPPPGKILQDHLQAMGLPIFKHCYRTNHQIRKVCLFVQLG